MSETTGTETFKCLIKEETERGIRIRAHNKYVWLPQTYILKRTDGEHGRSVIKIPRWLFVDRFGE